MLLQKVPRLRVVCTLEAGLAALPSVGFGGTTVTLDTTAWELDSCGGAVSCWELGSCDAVISRSVVTVGTDLQ